MPGLLERFGCTRGAYLVPDAALVVLNTFLIIGIRCGILSGGAGLLLYAFLDAFQAGKAHTVWVISLQNGFMFFCCFLSGPVIDRFGIRATSVLGSVLSFLGLFISAFAFNITFLIISFGLITGVGYGLLVIPCNLCIQQHTKRRRALATGLGNLGEGVGIFVMPMVIKWTMNTYGWRGTLFILSGLMLQTIPCSMLLLPPRKRHNTNFENKETKSSQSINRNLKFTAKYSNKDWDSCNLSMEKDTLELKNIVSSCCLRLKKKLQLGTKVPRLTDPICIMCILGLLCAYGAYSIPYVYIPMKVRITSGTAGTAAHVVSVTGIGTVTGGIFGTFLGSCTEFMPLLLLTGSFLLFGTSTICFLAANSSLSMNVLMFCLGLGGGILNSSMFTVIRDLVGVDRFHWITGIGLTISGLGNIAIVQLVAFIWEATDSIVWPFLIGGGVMAGGAIPILVARLLQSRQGSQTSAD